MPPSTPMPALMHQAAIVAVDEYRRRYERQYSCTPEEMAQQIGRLLQECETIRAEYRSAHDMLRNWEERYPNTEWKCGGYLESVATVALRDLAECQKRLALAERAAHWSNQPQRIVEHGHLVAKRARTKAQLHEYEAAIAKRNEALAILGIDAVTFKAWRRDGSDDAYKVLCDACYPLSAAMEDATETTETAAGSLANLPTVSSLVDMDRAQVAALSETLALAGLAPYNYGEVP